MENKFKDLKVDELMKKMNEQDNIIKKQEKNNENLEQRVSDLEATLKTIEKLKYKCKECNFMSISEQGLKTHTTRKHNNTNGKLAYVTCVNMNWKITKISSST